MRFVERLPLGEKARGYLDARQQAANRKTEAGVLEPAKEWKAARQTKRMQQVFGVLSRMMGKRERCMYCLDSHGSDIDHFWPKTPYPERMFVWENLLLCCTECGRFKGGQFPLEQGIPLPVDPTAEDPWQHLDFDPKTGT